MLFQAEAFLQLHEVTDDSLTVKKETETSIKKNNNNLKEVQVFCLSTHLLGCREGLWSDPTAQPVVYVTKALVLAQRLKFPWGSLMEKTKKEQCT